MREKSHANFVGSNERFMRESIDKYLSKFVYRSPNDKPTIANIEVIINYIRPPLEENNFNEKIGYNANVTKDFKNWSELD